MAKRSSVSVGSWFTRLVADVSVWGTLLFGAVVMLVGAVVCDAWTEATAAEDGENYKAVKINPDHPVLKQIKLPPGFQISLFADGVVNARAMARGDRGTIFVGSRKEGKVYALVDTNGDYKADRMYTLLSGLKLPAGVAFRDGSLYVSEVYRILRLDNIESRLSNPPKPVVVNSSFPRKRHHGWKFIGFSPDGWLYVPVGAPCNVCKRKDKRFSTIMRMKPDGSKLEIFAHGVRNTVGFDWHPKTKELWFTENGRDWMGNDFPPDELNYAPRKGLHFGFPYCHAGKPDPKYGKGHTCSNYRAPAQRLGPHVAALGMRFYRGKMFPAAYRNQIFIAEHGSWNRSTPIGYRVTLVRLKNNRAVKYEVFASGWLQGRKPLGRPVDVLNLPDGSMLVSDDYGDKIYRVTYKKKRPRPRK